MIFRIVLLAGIVLTLAGCQTVSNVYDGWFGAKKPGQKAA
ncbi:MAG: lipoprotein, partial [Burkholderiales bacterium]